MAPDWKNPMLKIKAPKVVLDPLEPISFVPAFSTVPRFQISQAYDHPFSQVKRCPSRARDGSSHCTRLYLMQVWPNQMKFGDCFVGISKAGESEISTHSTPVGPEIRRDAPNYLRHQFSSNYNNPTAINYNQCHHHIEATVAVAFSVSIDLITRLVVEWIEQQLRM